ncbi:MAG: LVIVD repeat-containing protein [Anaerolineae bacterium]
MVAVVLPLGFLNSGLLLPRPAPPAPAFARTAAQAATSLADLPTAPTADVLQFGGPVSALAQAPDGRWIYAGMGARLAVVDAADPANPRLTALLPLSQPPTAMLMVAAGAMVEPDQAEPRAQLDSLVLAVHPVQAVRPAQSATKAQSETPPLLYVAAGTAGVAVLTVAQPDAPELLGWIDTDWFAFDIALDARHERLVVADGGAGLAVYDLRDPAAPLRLGAVDTPSEARAVALDPSGLLAYVADWGRGLAVIDLADPAAPRLLGGVDSPGEAVDVALDANWVYLADRDEGLAVIDVADPTAPRLAVNVAPARAGAPEALRVDPDANRVYLADGSGGGLRWLRRSAPGLLADGGSLDLEGQPVALDLLGGGRRLAVANARLGLQLLDRGDGADASRSGPLLLSQLLSPSFVEGVALDPARGLAFLADAYGGVLVVDPGSAFHSDPASPQDPTGRPDAASPSGPPALPRVVGRLVTGAATHDLALSGDRAYVADAGAGLRAVDITDPAAPRDLGAADTPGEALGIDLDRAARRAYLADGPGGLRIYDLSESASAGPPRLLGQLPLAGFAWSLRVNPAAGLVYLADRLVGLRIIDVRDPALPRERAVFTAAGGVFEVALAGSRAYLATGQGGLRVLDISDPDRPRDLGSADGQGAAQGLALLGSRLFVTAGTDGLRRLDLRDPDRPRPDATWALEGLTERIAVEEAAAGAPKRAFVACEWGGLAIVAPVDQAAEPLILPWLGAAAR